MYSTRTTKTASGATAVQIVKYERRKRIVVKHIGSAHTTDELLALKQTAFNWIEKESHQPPLFPLQKSVQNLIPIDKCQYLGFRYNFIYEIFSKIFHLFCLDGINRFLLDLILIRIVQPASKLESLELLSEFFGKTYKRTYLYRSIPTLVALKDIVEEKFVTFAKKHLDFDFSIVFYDVTTLYFESFKEDKEEFRKPGFSKDNKTNQPQIVIGLIVTKEGFPVSYDVFAGNTFEGKTFIPTITKFKNTYGIKNLTIVADAAMISYPNVQSLIANNLSYIVGGRLASLKQKEIEEINQKLSSKEENLKKLKEKDGLSTRIETDRGTLICDFSFKRYMKDKREMDKQITKAKRLLEENKGAKRIKFIKNKDDEKTEQVLNTGLIEKTKMLLGIKGYYTNLVDETDKTIIDHYHSLWRVEKAFRIAKSDLSMRPIYHFKKQTIEFHILICFMALGICEYMELKTKRSIKKIVKLLKSVTDARLRNTISNEEFILRSEIPEETQKLLKTLWY
mgnify:FL=1